MRKIGTALQIFYKKQKAPAVPALGYERALFSPCTLFIYYTK